VPKVVGSDAAQSQGAGGALHHAPGNDATHARTVKTRVVAHKERDFAGARGAQSRAAPFDVGADSWQRVVETQMVHVAAFAPHSDTQHVVPLEKTLREVIQVQAQHLADSSA